GSEIAEPRQTAVIQTQGAAQVADQIRVDRRTGGDEVVLRLAFQLQRAIQQRFQAAEPFGGGFPFRRIPAGVGAAAAVHERPSSSASSSFDSLSRLSSDI